jgi:hypothetical protein
MTVTQAVRLSIAQLALGKMLAKRRVTGKRDGQVNSVVWLIQVRRPGRSAQGASELVE